MDFKLKKSNLNFRVYTAASLPATGTENDICIISEVPMTNWVMSPDKPSGIPRSDGDVWIQYSVTGNVFNVLKNSTMLLATISAWQYVNGAWVNAEAKSYQSGEWVDWWDGSLYDTGNQYTDYTGGWAVTYDGDASNPKYVKFENGYIDIMDQNVTYSWVETKNKINLTGKSKLKCSVSCVGMYNNSYAGFQLYIANSPRTPAEYVFVTPANGGSYEMVCDKLSNFDSPVYVGFKMTGSCAARVYKIWAE